MLASGFRKHIMPNSAKGLAALAAATAILAVTAGAALATPISDKIKELGGQAVVGPAKALEQTAPDGVGRYQHYSGGSIYWSPTTGAHWVKGLILQRWAALGWEKGWLGYPVSDEIDTYDGAAKVSKFQGGELIWRPATGLVSDVRSTDLVIDLPTRVGESWKVIQANAAVAGDSHSGPFTYCYDLISASGQGATKAAPFVSTADARIVLADDGFAGPDNPGNVVVQKLGTGRYASTLHLAKGSYAKRYGAGKILPQTMLWAGRPTPKSGDVLAETGDTGTGVGAYHIHYCVTTAPDRPAYAPFESVPVAFRNYDVSTDNLSWSPVAVGVPRYGQFVRRKAGGGGPAKVALVDVLNFGRVTGKVSLPAGVQGTPGSTVLIQAMAPWGEPLAGFMLTLNANNRAGPWTYDFTKVPDYPGLQVIVTYTGATTPAFDLIDGKGAKFDLKANETQTRNVTLVLSKEKQF